MENEKETKSKSKLIIIILLVVIVAIVAISAYFLISGKTTADIKGAFESKDEYSILLDEFVTNLDNEEGKGKNYLKIQVAIMYKDKKNTTAIEANTNKIRDIILNDLRGKTPENILKVEKTDELKTHLLGKINEALGEDLIEEVYFTNLVVQ